MPGRSPRPTSRPTRPTPGGRWRGGVGVGVGVSGLSAGCLLLLAYAAEPAGPWDGETVAHSHITAGLALALAAVTALLPWVFLKAEWMRRWWLILPALFAPAADLRLTLLAPGL
ncbi:hypothetical protein [Streptomyces yangpuensis]|uniref:hypothetical protein n=1 Tax=Streptomyces yangpuensis TaxID=1648182 RepID=UPI00366A247B